MSESNISKVYLLSVPLENDYKHTLYFTNESEQHSYFASKVKDDTTNFTYLRKDNLIYYPKHFDEIYECNYVMYQNSKYDNKWFYAFIKDMKYENDECTIIEIETDVIQSWLFNYNIKPSFVEREHVSDDTTGLHTVPEGLETGEYIVNDKYDDPILKETAIILAYNDYADSKYDVLGARYGGVYSGMGYSAFPNTVEGVNRLNEVLSEYDDEGKGDGINSIFMCPTILFTTEDEFGPMSIGPTTTPATYQIGRTPKKNVDGYTPRNNKLLTYPYKYLRVSNNAGSNGIYKEELFADDNCRFKIEGCVTPGCSIRLTPMNYKGAELNQDEGLSGGKFPICCWNSDVYTNWLTQNSVNVGVQAISGVGSVVAGAAMIATGAGAVAGGLMIAGGVGAIAGTMGQMHGQAHVPDQVKGNTNCGDVITGGKQNTFSFYHMSIKKEFAEMIDKYFDMFGYKVNMVKTPNKAHRSRYWYTKTIDINIDGAIPMNDMQKIKECYNSGITFWRNASEIQNYNLSNGIV